jgi:hypothetical protein
VGNLVVVQGKREFDHEKLGKHEKRVRKGWGRFATEEHG